MSLARGRRLIRKTLKRLYQQAESFSNRGLLYESTTYQHAAAIVRAVSSRGIPGHLAHQVTFPEIWKRSLEDNARLLALAAKLPAEADPLLFALDGREGWQWVASVLKYLEWRELSWRSRGLAEQYEIYLLAWRVVNDAMRSRRSTAKAAAPISPLQSLTAKDGFTILSPDTSSPLTPPKKPRAMKKAA